MPCKSIFASLQILPKVYSIPWYSPQSGEEKDLIKKSHQGVAADNAVCNQQGCLHANQSLEGRTRQIEGREGQRPAPSSRGRGRGSVGRGGRDWEEGGFSSLSWTLTPTVRWAREQVQVHPGPTAAPWFQGEDVGGV